MGIKNWITMAAVAFTITAGFSVAAEEPAAQAEVKATETQVPVSQEVKADATQTCTANPETCTLQTQFAVFVDKATPTKAQWDKFVKKLMMYIPNRCVDFADMFSLDLGLGANAKLDILLTRACVTGAGIGPNACFIKDFNRQYGFATQQGWNAHFLFTGAENSIRSNTVGNVQPYWQVAQGMSVQTEEIFQNKIRDYWAVGIDAAALVNAKFTLHPVEMADFFTGIFFYDLLDDDYWPRPVEY